MKTPEEVIIPVSRTRITLMLLGSLIFVSMGLWFMISPPELQNPIFGNKSALFILGLLAVLFFGISAILLIIKLFEQKPGLVIGREGILDNSSSVAAGLIKWEDLMDIGVIEVQKQKLLMLYVQNPHEYIKRQKSAIKRKIMQINYKSYSTPISISTNGLGCKFDELHDLVKQYMAQARL